MNDDWPVDGTLEGAPWNGWNAGAGVGAGMTVIVDGCEQNGN